MRPTFPAQTPSFDLEGGRRAELHVYSGEVLGAESNSVTHVAGVVLQGNGSVSSQTVSTGQLWLRAANGAKRGFTISGGLPFTPRVGQQLTVLSCNASGRPDRETELAIYSHEYDETHWLVGDDHEGTLKRAGFLGSAPTLACVLLFVTVIGIPFALAIGIAMGSRWRRTFRELRTKALASLDAAITATAASSA